MNSKNFQADRELIRSVIETLAQGETLLAEITDETYTRRVPIAFNASIGGHCLDHFRTLLDSASAGDLNYDHRERGTLIESDLFAALNATRELIEGCGRAVISPSEPGGGTWITLNDFGTTIALINWYSITAQVKGETVSRGEVVNATSTASTPNFVDAVFAELPLKRINAFRLIGFFPVINEIVEWRWDLKKLVQKNHRWKARQWISSGFEEQRAQRIRSQTFRQARKQSSAGRVEWLRRLHRSHSPLAGPFSTCMHRTEAATVSSTEVIASSQRAEMYYHAGAPCQNLASCHEHLNLQQLW